jgi:hypothetical protein
MILLMLSGRGPYKFSMVVLVQAKVPFYRRGLVAGRRPVRIIKAGGEQRESAGHRVSGELMIRSVEHLFYQTKLYSGRNYFSVITG